MIVHGSHLQGAYMLEPNQPILSALAIPEGASISLAGKRLRGGVTLMALGIADAGSCVLEMEHCGGLLGGSGKVSSRLTRPRACPVFR